MNTFSDVALYAGLEKLPANIPNVLASFASFTTIHLIVAPRISEMLFKETYGKMDARTKRNWCNHFVSQAHVLVIIPLALRAMTVKELSEDMTFGWADDNRIELMTSVASGYFLWDALDSIINYTDIGFVVHGVICLSIFMGSFRPFVAYFTSRCLMFELSTFFLNIHWFFDKTGRTGSQAQLVNAVLLTMTFFLVRIVYGGMYITPRLTTVLWAARQDVPMVYTFIYLGGNTCLQCLNVYWFSKMVQSINRRFSPQTQKKAAKYGSTAHSQPAFSFGISRLSRMLSSYL